MRTTGVAAFYEPAADRITMPDPSLFRSWPDYYATLAHEAAHASGHPDRLDRRLGSRFGKEAYAAEELVAELASAIIGSELGLPVTHLDDHAGYIGSWLKIMKADNRAVLTAAARAEEAANWVLSHGAAIGGASRSSLTTCP